MILSYTFNTFPEFVTPCNVLDVWSWLLQSDKRLQDLDTRCPRKLLCISSLEHKTNGLMWNKISCLVIGHSNFFWQLSRDRYLHGSGMSSIMTVSTKPSFRTTWEGGWCRGWQRKCWIDLSKSGHPCPCKNRLQQPPEKKKIGKGSLLNRLSCPPKQLKPSKDWSGLNYNIHGKMLPILSMSCDLLEFQLFTHSHLGFTEFSNNHNCVIQALH